MAHDNDTTQLSNLYTFISNHCIALNSALRNSPENEDKIRNLEKFLQVLQENLRNVDLLEKCIRLKKEIEDKDLEILKLKSSKSNELQNSFSSTFSGRLPEGSITGSSELGRSSKIEYGNFRKNDYFLKFSWSGTIFTPGRKHKKRIRLSNKEIKELQVESSDDDLYDSCASEDHGKLKSSSVKKRSSKNNTSTQFKKSSFFDSTFSKNSFCSIM